MGQAQSRNPIGFWKTVQLLLKTASHRAIGRQKRQRELFQYRSKKKAFDIGIVGVAFSILLAAVFNAAAPFIIELGVVTAQSIESEKAGDILVSSWSLDNLKKLKEHTTQGGYEAAREEMSKQLYYEASNRADRTGESSYNEEEFLRKALYNNQSHFILEDNVSSGLVGLADSGSFSTVVGSFILLWWLIGLIFQGEGVELDFQRRRHPMWEWLFTHPVHPGAVFLAEAISPIVANPVYSTAPLFFASLYSFIYGWQTGIAALFLIGLPMTIAFASFGKALEIGVTLRFPLRTRGSILGLMSWAGYSSFILLIFCGFSISKIVNVVSGFLFPLSVVRIPILELILGARPDGTFQFWYAVLACWIIAGTALLIGFSFMVWGGRKGIMGASDSAVISVSKEESHALFGSDPLYRKEVLWFKRDTSAAVQTLLIPITIAGFQLFNMRSLSTMTGAGWYVLCGSAILFGTHFFLILGPRALASEGPALWIALTWPRGLENLLKAKARLINAIASMIVFLVFIYAAIQSPNEGWKIVLVAFGWIVYSRSMAYKAVTLVTATSASGELEPLPQWRRWAAQLGSFTFCIGVFSQQWSMAIMGIVFSCGTSAAMWQNFRARLPYLYDQWSEKLPTPPTLMHALIAISSLVEGGAVVTGITALLIGLENIGVVMVIAYGISAAVVAIITSIVLNNRGVFPSDIWFWKNHDRTAIQRYKPFGMQLLFGIGAGIYLGLFAYGYLAVLSEIPSIAHLLTESSTGLEKFTDLKIAFGIIAILLCPFAEEYLFRGLLFRNLDREVGGVKALLANAVFFAAYHPLTSFLPVALLGIVTAVLYKRTGTLTTAVITHMTYNAIVLLV